MAPSLAESLATATAAGVAFKLCRLAASCLALVAFGSRPPALHWVPPWERSSMQTFAWALGASTALLCCRIVALLFSTDVETAKNLRRLRVGTNRVELIVPHSSLQKASKLAHRCLLSMSSRAATSSTSSTSIVVVNTH